MTALMKPAGATRPCLHQGSAPLRGAASQCAMALNLRAGRSCNGPARTRSSGITSIPESPSRTASSRASTAHCAMSCSTRSCSTAWLTPAGSWPSGATTTTMFGPTLRWEIERLHKRVGRSCRTIASRPARLCRRAWRNIQPQDSRYDRGTAGGQVNVKHPILPAILTQLNHIYRFSCVDHGKHDAAQDGEGDEGAFRQTQLSDRHTDIASLSLNLNAIKTSLRCTTSVFANDNQKTKKV